MIMCGGALGGSIFDIGGVKKTEDAAKRAKDQARRERERQEAIAKAELAKQQELADAKTAYEQSKKKERLNRVSNAGGGLSTKYQGANLGGVKDKYGSDLGG
jgi:hypothetical protein